MVETSVKHIFASKNSAIKVFACSLSVVRSASEEAAESDEDSAVVVIVVFDAVCTGGEIVPQAVIVIAIAVKIAAENTFFIHKFSF